MKEVDLVKIPSSYAINKVKEAGFFRSPAFENNLPVEIIRNIKEILLHKLY
jgi:hypothetical protein